VGTVEHVQRWLASLPVDVREVTMRVGESATHIAFKPRRPLDRAARDELLGRAVLMAERSRGRVRLAALAANGSAIDGVEFAGGVSL